MNPVKVRNVEIGTGIPKICVPIVGVKREEIIQAAAAICEAGADVVEWRTDWYEDVLDEDKTKETLALLRQVLPETPLLLTFRTFAEGGERDIGRETYEQLIKWGISTGYTDMVDVELSAGEPVVRRIIELAHASGVKVIVSNHDFQGTPMWEELLSRLCKMRELGADIPKIAVMPHNKKDLLTLLAVTEEMTFRHPDTPIITMSMAGMGVLSRISGETFGSALTFGVVQHASAPGQMQVEELRTALSILHKGMNPMTKDLKDQGKHRIIETDGRDDRTMRPDTSV